MPLIDSRPLSARLFVEIRLGRGQNDRENHFARAKRIKREKFAVGWSLKQLRKPAIPCVCRLTRHAPGRGLDSDNLQGSLKATRDAVADWLGIDDARLDLVDYEYDQRKHSKTWGVDIEFSEAITHAE